MRVDTAPTYRPNEAYYVIPPIYSRNLSKKVCPLNYQKQHF
jgi:hypothetical protein